MSLLQRIEELFNALTRCIICEEKLAIRKNTCYSCQMFFYRTVFHGMRLRCRKLDGKCDITMQPRKCSACWFKKCIRAKMQWRGYIATPINFYKYRLKRRPIEEETAPGPHLVPTFLLSAPPTDELEQLIQKSLKKHDVREAALFIIDQKIGVMKKYAMDQPECAELINNDSDVLSIPLITMYLLDCIWALIRKHVEPTYKLASGHEIRTFRLLMFDNSDLAGKVMQIIVKLSQLDIGELDYCAMRSLAYLSQHDAHNPKVLKVRATTLENWLLCQVPERIYVANTVVGKLATEFFLAVVKFFKHEFDRRIITKKKFRNLKTVVDHIVSHYGNAQTVEFMVSVKPRAPPLSNA